MIDQSEFGRTAHGSSRVIFGAAALSRLNQRQADELLPTLLDFGVNHLDTAAAYGDSELRLAPWLAAHPERFFLATKTGDRSGDGARASLERSLGRLGIDHVDLVQLHNLVEEDEWQQAHGPDGAVQALARARDEGLTRFIGVTGHGLRIAAMHRRSLERFDFDSVLLPFNFSLLQSGAYRDEVEALLETCRHRNVAVQTIKSVARRRWTGEARERSSWYEPLRDEGPIRRAVGYVLARPQLFLLSSSDPSLLRTTLSAASETTGPPADAELRADMATFDVQPLFDGAALERI